MSLDTKTSKFAIVFNTKTGLPIVDSFIQEQLNTLFVEYSYILHDKDIDDCGIVKTLHYHLVCKTEKRCRIATIINKLSLALNLSPFNIQAKKCVSYVGAIQYLVHKNDKNKFQYDVDAIHSSIPREELELLIASDNDNITIDRLISVINECRTLTDVIKSVGLSNYIGYRNVIKDLWNDRLSSPH